MCVHHVVDFVI